MVKIEELKLRKILVKIDYDNKGDKIMTETCPIGWQKMTYEELEKINTERKKDIKKRGYNQYYIIPDREYLIIDTDGEKTYLKLVNLLKELNIYNENAITKSFSGKNKNQGHKRHFWFKINKRQFKHITKEGKVDLTLYPYKKGEGNGEIFFGSSCFIGELIDSELNDIPTLDYGDYNEIYDELTKIKETGEDKIDIINDIDFTDDENEKEDEKEEEKEEKPKKNISNKNKNENELIKILDNLNKKRYQLYSYWLILYFVFVNENFSLDLFDAYSKKFGGKKYDKEKNYNILKNIKPQKSYTIATLYYWLKEDNKTVFSELCKTTRSDFWNIASKLDNITIADFYFQLDPESYIYNKKSSRWYEYDKNNILVQSEQMPITLSNGMGRKLQEIAKEQYQLIDPDNENFKIYSDIYKKFYKTVGTNKFIKDCIEQLKLPYSKEIDELINNINYFAFKNAVYDIRTNKIREIRKDDYITKNTGYDYNKNYITEENEKTIRNYFYSLFEDDEMTEYFLKITGCQLFGNDIQQKIYFYSGKGGNGKSLTQNLIKNSLGGYYTTVSNNFLFGSLQKGAPDPELLSLIGVRYVAVSEPDDTEKKLNVANLKRFSGSEMVEGRKFRSEEIIKFMPQFTLNISCNDLPELSSTDGGMRRRARNIYFPFQFRDEKELLNNANNRKINVELSEKLNKPEIIQTFINLLLKYAFENKTIKIKEPNKVIEDSSKYMDENNPLYEWFSESIIRTNDNKDTIQSLMLINNYSISAYCKKKLSTKDFNKYMDKFEIYNDTKNKNKRFYYGIKFNLETE